MSEVALTVPATAEYLRLVRMTAAESGARADLSIEDIEDLRIAVDELTYALIGTDPGATMTMQYTAAPGVVEIEGTRATNGTTLAISDLSRTIIRGVASEYEISDEENVRRFRLVKRTRT